MTYVIGCDPGTEQSALVVFDPAEMRVVSHAVDRNDAVLEGLAKSVVGKHAILVIEMVESFGMPVGREVFETVFWSGRFAQAWAGRFDSLPRRIIKQHLCHTARATDANIRQALIDRFGPGPEKAIGKKATPGPLYGIKGHCIAALAVAVTYADQHAASVDQIRRGVVAEF